MGDGPCFCKGCSKAFSLINGGVLQELSGWIAQHLTSASPHRCCVRSRPRYGSPTSAAVNHTPSKHHQMRARGRGFLAVTSVGGLALASQVSAGAEEHVSGRAQATCG